MKSILASVLAIFFLLSLHSTADAQQQQVNVTKIDIKKIEFDTQKTPDFQAGGVKGKKIPNPRDWLEIEVEFEVDANPRDGIVPQLMIRYYVAIQSENGSTQLLTGDVNHVNIVAGEETFSSAYISPQQLGKITGDFKNFQPSSVKGLAVEVFHNGVSKGGKSESGPSGRWWESMASSAGVQSKEKTPFRLLWIDRYADVESTR